jgi:hypothetical protein
VDKVVGNCPLTGENAFTGADLNKMPNPQAEFNPNKINDLAPSPEQAQEIFDALENKFFCA